MFTITKVYTGEAWTPASFDACAQVVTAEQLIENSPVNVGVEKAVSANGEFAGIRLSFDSQSDMDSFVNETRQDPNFIIVRAHSVTADVEGDLKAHLDSL